MCLRSIVLGLALALSPVLASAAPISPVTALFVFGDSLSDSGNGFALSGGNYPPTPPFAGKWTNGPVAVERLAANLGVPLAPSQLGGTNYAVGGAATGQVQIKGAPAGTTTNNFNTISPDVPAALRPAFANTGLDSQVVSFLGSGSSFNPASALFVVWAGPNNFLISRPETPDEATAAILGAVSDLANHIATLYLLGGARNFLVPNMPDLSLTPAGGGDLALYQLSLGFALAHEAALQALEANPALAGINLIRFNTFALLQAVVANPAAYGFTNVTDACLALGLGGITVCATPPSYLSWDGFHPTTAAHRLLGDLFTEAVTGRPVPEPATALLVAVGLAAGLQVRRRRSQGLR